MLHIDDRLHSPGNEQDWFEAYWFGFYVPARKLSVYIYPWFRPNLGTWGGGVLAWDDRGQTAWTMLHCDYAWGRPFEGEASMINGEGISTPQGVRIDCLEPAKRYRIRYDRPALGFDIEFEASGPANQIAATTAEENIFKGHIDQPGHYSGQLRVGSDMLDVDCYCVRDRSWGPRRDDFADMHVGYYHATASAQDAFLLVTHFGDEPDRSSLLSGYLIRDGRHAKLTEGWAQLMRNIDHSPASCLVEATDEFGRKLVARGVANNHIALQLQPGMFNWSSLAEWQFDDVTAYGELQDTWHPDKYRAFARGQAPK